LLETEKLLSVIIARRKLMQNKISIIFYILVFFIQNALASHNRTFDHEEVQRKKAHALFQEKTIRKHDLGIFLPSSSLRFNSPEAYMIAALLGISIAMSCLPTAQAQIFFDDGEPFKGVLATHSFSSGNCTDTNNEMSMPCKQQAQGLRASQIIKGEVLPKFIKHYTHPGIYSLPTKIKTEEDAQKVRVNDYYKAVEQGLKLPESIEDQMKIFTPRWKKLYQSYGPDFGNDDPIDRNHATAAYDYATTILFKEDIQKWQIKDLARLNEYFTGSKTASYRNNPILIRQTKGNIPGFFNEKNAINYFQTKAPEDLTSYIKLANMVKAHFGEAAHLKASWDNVIGQAFNEGEQSPHYDFLKKYFALNTLKHNDIKTQMTDMLGKTKRLVKKDPLEAAAYFHMRLVNIHPWDDGNGRVARLGANLLLIKGGFPAIAFTSEERYATAIHDFNQGNPKAFRIFLEEEICRMAGLYNNPNFREGLPFEELLKQCKVEDCEKEFDKLMKTFGL
jgi:hypothetical protein